MNINITVAAGLNLLRRHKKLLIQLFIQLIKDQTSFRGYKRRIRIGVFLIADIHDRLALFVYIVQHTHKILLIVTVIPITLCHHRFYLFQCAFHDIVHDRNGDRAFIQLVYLFYDIIADMAFFFLRKLGQRPVGAFPYRVDHLLHIKIFFTAVFFDHLSRPVRFI